MLLPSNEHYNDIGDAMMDVNMRLKSLMDECGWTEYRLAKEARLSQSTVSNIFRRNTVPSVATLEAICDAMGISLPRFFEGAGERAAEETDSEVGLLLRRWSAISPEKKRLVLELLKQLI